MKEFLKKRSGAVTVLILVIVLSTLFSCHRSLTKKQDKIEAILTTGSDGSGIGINSDLEKRVDYSRNLVKVAQKYQGLDREITALSNACDALVARDGGAAEAYSLNEDLSDAAQDLYLAMEGLLAEKDEEYRQSLYANILSRNDTISHEAAKYNEKALDFNSILHTFPANILKYPSFVKECELFGK